MLEHEDWCPVYIVDDDTGNELAVCGCGAAWREPVVAPERSFASTTPGPGASKLADKHPGPTPPSPTRYGGAAPVEPSAD